MNLPQNRRLREALKSIYHTNRATAGEALVTLIHEALAMEKALRYYADDQHYIDGAPHLIDHEDHLLTIADEGFTAQWALHLVDVSYGPYLLETEDETGPAHNGGEAGDSGDGGDPQRLDTLDVRPIPGKSDHGPDRGGGERRAAEVVGAAV